MTNFTITGEPIAYCPLCGKCYYGELENQDSTNNIVADGVEKVHCVCFECLRNFYYIKKNGVITLIMPE